MLASVFGKTVEAIEDFRGWFADRFAAVAAIDRPEATKTKEVLGRATEWVNAEIAAGHAVSTEFPPEVQAAVTKIQRAASKERQAVYASAKPALDADSRRRCDRIDTLYEQLVTEVGEFRDVERHHRQLAVKCGAPAPTAIAPSGDAIGEQALIEWRHRVQRILNPPVTQSAQRGEPNVLVLD